MSQSEVAVYDANFGSGRPVAIVGAGTQGRRLAFMVKCLSEAGNRSADQGNEVVQHRRYCEFD
jgi:hypothetical protein